ncbi:MAG: DNA polymerase IV [Crocinitomicaceae bacterium]
MNLEQRKIIHVDMDAFFASVEQLDNPDLRGKPIAVGGSGQRGVIAAASYEARKFGVRSAMSSALAAKKCPDLIFVKHRFERYKEISAQIRSIFLEYTDLVEPLSLDEAFLDVTENWHNHSSATEIAREIRQKIFEQTGLTASAGISINKFMAKLASDINKPNGQKTIKPHEVIPFLEQLPIGNFFGVGKATAEKMKSWGIFNGYQLKQHSLTFLKQNFGKSGTHYYHIVRGIHNSPVRPNRVRKSIGTERTYSQNKIGKAAIIEALTSIADDLEKRIERANKVGHTITVKYKFSDFTIQTRSKTAIDALFKKTDFWPIVMELVDANPTKKSIRLLGITLSNLKDVNQPKNEREAQLKFTF